MSQNFTHYTYIGVANGLREPTSMLDLRHCSIRTRVKLIHELTAKGELLAKCPWGVECPDLETCRKAVQWLYDRRKPRRPIVTSDYVVAFYAARCLNRLG